MFKIKAVGYARYSSDKQREESILHQIEKIEEYCQNNNIELLKIYADEAKTGTNIERDNLKLMLDDAKRDQFDYVIVYKIDRLSRSVGDALNIRHELAMHNIQVISVLENFDDQTPEGGFFNHISMAMSEFYVKNLRRAVMVGLEQNALSARGTGGIQPLGFDMDENLNYVKNEEEAKIVNIIFKQTLEGKSYRSIASYLNGKGYKNKIGRSFRPNFTETLRNRKYIGEFVYNRSIARRPDGTRNGHQSKLESEIIRIPDAIPEIVDKKTFYKVQEILNKRQIATFKVVDRSKYILSGVSTCGVCGRAVNGNKKVAGRNKYLEYTYKCGNKSDIGHLKPINMDKMNKFVINYLKKGILNPRERARLHRLILREYKQSLSNLTKEQVVVKNKIKKLEEEIKNIAENLYSTPKGMIEIVNVELDKRLVRLEKARVEESLIEDALKNNINIERDSVYYKQREYLEGINSTNPLVVKGVIEKVIKSIEYTNELITIKINLENFIDRIISRGFIYTVQVDRDAIVWPNKHKIEITNDFDIVDKNL